jgi:hypothetical protein
MRKGDDATGMDVGLRSSMFRYRLVGGIEDGFGKGKFEHDLTFIIGHFENRNQKTTLRVFGLQQFPDHGSRNFPCAIRISQLFAFRIGDQFIADTRVEEISRHGWKATFIEGPAAAGCSHRLFIWNWLRRFRMGGALRPTAASLNLLICHCFDGGLQKTVNLPCTAA